MSPLAIQDLSFAYGDRTILQSLSLEFPTNNLIGIVGPNGCGKSTLLSLLAHLQTPSSGSINLDGRPLQSYRRKALAQKIAYLPQNPLCPPGITVGQVLDYGRHPYQSLFRQFSRKDAEKIGDICELLHLGSVLHRPLEQLSGGQRQKAWLGMTLVQDTDIILLDEPTSALDIGHQHEVMECIRAICDRGKTVIVVIHDLAAAARFCDYLLALKDGSIHKFGAPADVITESVILSLYGVQVEILTGRSGGPVIAPLALQRGPNSEPA